MRRKGVLYEESIDFDGSIGNFAFISFCRLPVYTNAELWNSQYQWGRSDNYDAVVTIESRGTFRLESNATITGNADSIFAGGVYVNGGSFSSIVNGIGLV